MLTHLHVKNFAIIDNLDLDLSPGMTAITGETGAGKSIAIDALSLALGDRADISAIREGQTRAEVIATFDVLALPHIKDWLRERELEMDQECTLRRTISRDGGSRAYVNGSPVPLQLVKELAANLVDIYSQNQHQSLLDREEQRRLLDGYAGLQGDTKELKEIARRANALEKEITALNAAEQQRTHQISYLEFQLSELDALQLKPREWEQLELEHTRRANQEKIANTLAIAIAALEDDEQSVLTQLNRIGQRLQHIADFDKEIAAVHELMEGACVQLEEGLRTLRGRLVDNDADSQSLNEIEDRMAAIMDLARKHKVDPQELHSLHSTFATELTSLQSASENIQRLHSEHLQQKIVYSDLAKRISAQRFAAAEQFSAVITEWMQKLGMQGGAFSVALVPFADTRLRAQGLEEVEFLVRTNAGTSPQPLAKIASGGELSRLSLAIGVVTSQVGGTPTLIFDEVDVGIGGATAQIVGQLLRSLAKQRQVLCITHQAQVAAHAEHHFKVAKHIQDGHTVAQMTLLNNKDRHNEVARMIGGVELTKATLAHAKEMLSSAQ